MIVNLWHPYSVGMDGAAMQRALRDSSNTRRPVQTPDAAARFARLYDEYEAGLRRANALVWRGGGGGAHQCHVDRGAYD